MLMKKISIIITTTITTLLLSLSPTPTASSPPPNLLSSITTPSSPLPSATASTCQLDLSAELFGGVEEACGSGRTLDRSRCCPVLAAWLFAAHSRSAFHLRQAAQPSPAADNSLPMLPDTDSKRCSDALQTALAARNIKLIPAARSNANATCDAALCFCGIHLHEITSLSCSPAFNISNAAAGEVVVEPGGAVSVLERDCRNASHDGCSRCLNSLQKLKGNGGGGGERMDRMMDRDCRLMGLTWLLGRNKTEYIPTVSAVLRAIMYSGQSPVPPYRCSSDGENMPLAVDTFQFQRAAVRDASSVSDTTPWVGVYYAVALSAAVGVVLV